jgi:hypothetical protein
MQLLQDDVLERIFNQLDPSPLNCVERVNRRFRSVGAALVGAGLMKPNVWRA